MYRVFTYLLSLLCLLTIVSCDHTKPQSPSNRRAEQQDSATVAMVLVNQQLVQEADRDVINYIKQNGEEQYTLYETGYWARKTFRTDNRQIHQGDELDLSIVLYSLDGKMLLDCRNHTQVADTDLLIPVWEFLQLMNRGEQAELIIPWYAAYGSTGSRDVPPYTNIRIQITDN